MEHPCLCDICLKARDSELERLRKHVEREVIEEIGKQFFRCDTDHHKQYPDECCQSEVNEKLQTFLSSLSKNSKGGKE